MKKSLSMKLQCKQCWHEWVSKKLMPCICPQCHSYKWFIYYPANCEICGLTFMRLHRHHVNGDHNFNERINLLIICASCHTYIHSGITKRIKSYKPRDKNITGKLKVKLDKFRQIWLDNKRRNN